MALPMPELAPVTRAFCPLRIFRMGQAGMTTSGRDWTADFGFIVLAP